MPNNGLGRKLLRSLKDKLATLPYTPQDMSIRNALMMWYVSMLTAVLILFSTALYVVVAVNLDRNLNNMLSLRARDTAVSLVAHWLLERNRRSYSYEGDIQSFAELTQNPKEFELFLKRWNTVRRELNQRASIRLINFDRDVIFESANFPLSELPPSRFIAPVQTIYKKLKVDSGNFRLLHHPVLSKGDQLYAIQVAVPLTDYEASLGNVRTALLILVPLAVLLTSGVGWFLAWQAMRPVDVMVRQAKHISAFRLNERLNVPQTGDELQRLALTFNDLLERIERSFLRLRQFSAAASHELRTPLTVMRGELEVALRRERDPEEYRRVLSTTLAALQDLSRIVEDLLTFARSHTDEDTLKTERVDLMRLAARVIESWKPFARQENVDLVLEQTSSALHVLGETSLLERLIANLLDNAIRHAPDAGRVSVELAYAGREVELRVSDNGPGVGEEDLPHIFDRFFSRRTSEDLEQKGTSGLGLGLCRWIAEAHNGTIRVESNQPHGAVFIVSFPQGR